MSATVVIPHLLLPVRIHKLAGCSTYDAVSAKVQFISDWTDILKYVCEAIENVKKYKA